MESNKKKVFNLIYGKTFMILLLLIIQILIMGITIFKLTDYSIFLYGFLRILSIVLSIYIVNKKQEPSFKLSWILIILIMPVFGSIFYLLFEFQYGVKVINKKLISLQEETSIYLVQDKSIMEELKENDIQVENLARYIGKVAKYPIYKNTKIDFFSSGESKYNKMLEEIEKAEKFIFLEYFIIEEGEMWSKICNLLEKKAKEGVDVRVMYDGMCSVSILPYNYPDFLMAKGIKCKVFSPIVPILSTHQNNRDHRKILVVDGKVAFNGGINIGDAYINRISRYGHWKDCGVMLKGDAVKSFTIMFLQMWNLNENIEENYMNYIDTNTFKYNYEDGFVMPYGDIPLRKEQIGENVYLDILYTAKKYVHIMTPYLIIDSEMRRALTYASKRGVDIKLILPHIPDKKLVFILTNTYYEELLEAGVKIYEYLPGFVHNKVFISDNIKSIIGTINLDFRSLYLHFECATFIYKNKIINKIEEDFQTTLKQCIVINEEYCKKRNILYKLLGGLLRVFAPLL